MNSRSSAITIDRPRRDAGWSCAVFAHNEQATIIRCLDSLQSQLEGHEMPILVLANGCTDQTQPSVQAYIRSCPNVHLTSFDRPDKASTWNRYVNELAPDAHVHFFIDGDVTAAPGALRALADRLDANPEAVAAGAVPGTGRDRQGWSARMRRFGRLAGGLYELRGIDVSQLRQAGIRLPPGLIGDDLLLSCLVKEQLNVRGLFQPSRRLVLAPEARFLFRSLSLCRPRDWLAYARRLIRYRIRDYQITLVLQDIQTRKNAAIPRDLSEIYHRAPALPHYQWRGRITPLDLLAVRHIRRAARQEHGETPDRGPRD